MRRPAVALAATASAAVLLAVGGPAAVASYQHAAEVARRYGEEDMARWLPLTTDGMLVAALIVMAWRRWRGEPVGFGPWFAFALGMAATLGANLASADWTVGGVLVAVWPPIALMLTLELVAIMIGLLRPAAPPVSTSQPADDTVSWVPADQLDTVDADPDPADEEPTDDVDPPREEPPPLPPVAPVDPLLSEVQAEADRTGKRPTADALMKRHRIGADRARKLRDAVKIPEGATT